MNCFLCHYIVTKSKYLSVENTARENLFIAEWVFASGCAMASLSLTEAVIMVVSHSRCKLPQVIIISGRMTFELEHVYEELG